ncbi:MAG: plasmid-related protein [Xanthomonadales bacterium]|nr:plasmid-related protein [Xanthomonadales bacterium]
MLDGPLLLTVEGLAELLHRTPTGIRQVLKRNTDFSAQLRGARVKLGRRVYFRRDLLGEIITSATGR